jgi:uncharacterized protein
MADKRIKTTIIAGVAAGAAAAWLTSAIIKARRIRLEEASIFSPELPESFDGVRIVFVSDIHAGPFVSPSRMASIVDMINGLEPDILILGGDNVGGRRRGDEIFYPEAKRFRANLAKVAVIGNHDAWEGVEHARRGLAEAGITLLENDNAAIEKDGQRIFVAGLEDLWTADPDVKKAAKGIKKTDFAVLVTHNPDELARSVPPTAPLWDLALAGHTHGGQVTLFGKGMTRPTHFGQRYRTGWRTEHGVPILVSNGVGMVTVPFRVFASPEVHVITLRRA